MKRVFPLPPPIVVPDGTELHEIIGPRILSELGLPSSDGLSLALGILPARQLSKIHIHPVVWHFAWVKSGNLTVMMKDQRSEDAYTLDCPTGSGVLTEPGTFFQLRNESDQPVEVYYIVGPGFAFELGDEGSTPRHNDAVVFDHSWDELSKLGWRPPELPTYQKFLERRRESLVRQATAELQTVRPVRWSLRNGPGSVAVPSQLHNQLVQHVDDAKTPKLPDETKQVPQGATELASEFISYCKANIGIQPELEFVKVELQKIISLKCTETPSYAAEYETGVDLLRLTKSIVHPDEVWHLLLFGKHDELRDGCKLSRFRKWFLDEVLDYAVTIGGGFSSSGAMDNYRAYRGGLYTNPESYRRYVRDNVEGVEKS